MDDPSSELVLQGDTVVTEEILAESAMSSSRSPNTDPSAPQQEEEEKEENTTVTIGAVQRST